MEEKLARKNFGKGIDAIFSRDEKVQEEEFYDEPKIVKEGNTKKNKPYVRACVQFDEDMFSVFKALAHWERLSHRQLIDKLLKKYIEEKGSSFVGEALKSFSEYSELNVEPR